jgi:hypothetical protein
LAKNWCTLSCWFEVFRHRRVFAGELLEALFASGIGQAAAIENKAAAIAGLVLRQAAMEGKLKTRTVRVSVSASEPEVRPCNFSEASML